MISRYSRKELTSIWSEENKYKIWLNIEIAAAQAMEKLGYIPKGVSLQVKKKGKINVKRIHSIESKVKHDVIAFLTSITEKAGIKARYLHQGMTSSDVLDTGFNIQLVQSGKILLKDIDQILKWSSDSMLLEESIRKDSDGETYSLTTDIMRALNIGEFIGDLIPMSNLTGEGMVNLQSALSRIINLGEEVED